MFEDLCGVFGFAVFGWLKAAAGSYLRMVQCPAVLQGASWNH